MALATTIQRYLSKIFEGIGQLFINFFDLIFGSLQKLIGLKAMPYVFVLPNLLIFGIFILFPMLLNFRYAFTGGTSFFPDQREWVGLDNFKQLLTCGNFLDPNSCREDLFWRYRWICCFSGRVNGCRFINHRLGIEPQNQSSWFF
jgi:alpha-1,4-digalacturonate transport system permease protein